MDEPSIRFGRTVASRIGFLAPTAALFVSFASLATASTDSLGGPSMAIVLRVVLATCATGVLWIGYRITTASVVLLPDRIVVRNVFRSRTVPRRRVLCVVAPDERPAQWLPYLVAEDGERIKMFAIARLKNRMWGSDQGAQAGVEGMAKELDVPLERPREGERPFRWG